MTFVNIFLGTDTQFTPEKNEDKGYDNPETLSAVATFINPNSKKINDIIEHHHDEVVVINGPTTLGSEVGARIATGVLQMLSAIARGETKICIAGHSRGAVESILASHELDRIKKLALKSELTLENFKNSSCYLTKLEMDKLTSEFEKLNLEELNKNLKKLEVALFCIDPVPGGSILGMNAIPALVGKPFAWRDERFYKIPPIVTDYYQIINENERTRGFKPIIPRALDSKTKFVVESLPGHHGSSCGNLKDQARQLAQLEGSDLVQKFTVAKLVEFLSAHEVKISQDVQPEHPLHECLNPNSNLFLKLYEDIHKKKKEVFSRFDQTSYPILSQEQSIQKLFGYHTNQRIIHNGEHTDTFHDDIFPPIARFLNQQHANLALIKALRINDEETISVIFVKAMEKLKDICEGINSGNSSPSRQSPTPESSAASESHTMTDSTIEGLKAVASPEGKDRLFKILNPLMEEIKQIFLQNQFQSNEERQALIQAIITGYKTFKPKPVSDTEINGADDSISLEMQIFNKLKAEIQQTLQLKQKSLVNHYEHLKDKLVTNHFMTTLLGKIEKLKNTELESEIKQKISNIFDALKDLNTPILDVQRVKGVLERLYIEIIDEHKENPELNKKINVIAALLNDIINSAIGDIESYTHQAIFTQLKDLYDQNERYKATIKQLTVVDSSLAEKNPNFSKDFAQKQDSLAFYSAKYLLEHDLTLENLGEYIRKDHALFSQIETFYHGLQKNPTVTLEQFDFLAQEIAQLNDEIRKKEGQLQQLRTATAAEIAEKDTQIAAKDTQIAEVQAQLQQLRTTKEQEIQQLTAAKDTQIAAKDTQIAAKDAVIAAKDAEIQTLTDQNLTDEELCSQFQHLQVIKKLKTLTENYHNELKKDAIKLFKNKSINLDNLLVHNGDALANEKNNLKDKLKCITELQEILNDENLDPTKRTKSFYQKLDAAQISTKNHDNRWIRFIQNALALLALVITGIVPGVAYLTYNQTNLFWNKDQKFEKQSEQALKPITPKNKPN